MPSVTIDVGAQEQIVVLVNDGVALSDPPCFGQMVMDVAQTRHVVEVTATGPFRDGSALAGGDEFAVAEYVAGVLGWIGWRVLSTDPAPRIYDCPPGAQA